MRAAKRSAATAARTVGALVTTMLAVMTLATSAGADHAYVEISIPIDTVVRADEGSITDLATEPVPTGFADHLCTVKAHSENQHSIHEGNDLLVRSGDSMVVLSDVEAEPGRVIDAEEGLRLVDVVTVSVRMGPDEVLSAGIEVAIECVPEETTTTTTSRPTTTADVANTTVTTPEETTTSAAETDLSTTTGSTTTTVEVLGTQVLPFTGAGSGLVALLAVGSMVAGGLVLLGVRQRDH